jgi:tripartite-type tricarboxylate transporter receptor subunit TctC
MNRRQFVLGGVGGTIGACVKTSVSFGQSRFPERPIRLVIPFPPGGPYDLLGRTLGMHLGELLGQPFVIENKGGGETSIGAAAVAFAQPDGYSLLLGCSPTHVVTPLAMTKPTYDPVKDFAQIAVMNTAPYCLAVRADSPAKTLQDLVAMIKANPGKYNYAESASGSRLSAELFKLKAGNLDLVGIPYKGSAASMQDLMADRIQVYPAIINGVVDHHRTGSVRILAVLSAKRSQAVPDVPTTAEAGLPDTIFETFTVLCAPSRTPAPIIGALYGAISKVLNEAAFIALQKKMGSEPVTDSNPETAARFVLDQIETIRPYAYLMQRKS